MQIPVEMLKQCWFLAGPTAVGKSATALLLAEHINAEILSLDSMAIYRGMDIGTAKPSLFERQQVPHHLLDIIEPHQEYSTADYLQAAGSAVEQILNRGRVPLFVGGTGLYLRSLLRGVFAGPAANWEIRQQWETEEARSPGLLWQRLQQVDSATAARLHPHDQRRITRALEVYELTGQPLSQHHQELALSTADCPEHVFWLHPPRDWLYERIDQRVDLMIANGLITEVEQLLQQTPPPGRSARQGLGYKEVIDHLEQEIPLTQTIQTIKLRTHQFAKRQHTWFRNLEECREVPIQGTETAEQLVARLVSTS